MPAKPEDEFRYFPEEAGGAARAGESAPGAFTQIFGRPASSEGSQEAPVSEPRSSPGEFTQIFTPLAKPTTTPEMLRSGSTAPSAESRPGEFTQFFSALSARSEPAAQAAPTASPVQSASPEAPRPSVKPAEEPGTFTQLLQQIQGQPAGPLASPGEQAERRGDIASPRGSLDSSPAREVTSKPQFGGSPQGEDRAEIFRRPEAGRELSASDAQMFAALRQPLASPPAAPESFTDIFQRVTEPPVASARPASAPLVPSTGRSSQNPFAPAAIPETGGSTAGSGEFTRLMQNLAQPSAVAPARHEPAPPVRDAFFADPTPAQGTSEFTRVMRGDALRAGGAPVPRSSQVANGSAVAPGLAIAPGPAQGTAGAPEKKPNRLVMLLIVMNGVLLLALLIVAIIFLLHRH